MSISLTKDNCIRLKLSDSTHSMYLSPEDARALADELYKHIGLPWDACFPSSIVEEWICGFVLDIVHERPGANVSYLANCYGSLTVAADPKHSTVKVLEKVRKHLKEVPFLVSVKLYATIDFLVQLKLLKADEGCSNLRAVDGFIPERQYRFPAISRSLIKAVVENTDRVEAMIHQIMQDPKEDPTTRIVVSPIGAT